MNKRFIGIKVKFLMVLSVLILFTGCEVLKLSQLRKPESDKGTLFGSPVEIRQNKYKALENFFEEFKKRSKDAKSSIARRINIVETAITEAEVLLQKEPLEEEFYNKELVSFNERKQNLINIKESWSASEEIIQKHLKLLSKIIESLKNNKKITVEYKLVYSLKDFKDIQNKISTLRHKISADNFKKDWIQKQKKSEEDLAAFLQKEIEVSRKDQRRLLEKTLPVGGEEKETAEKDLKQLAKLLEISTSVLNEKKELAESTIERMDLEISYRDNDLWLLDNEFEDLRKEAVYLYDRLYIDKADLEMLEEELAKEKQRTSEVLSRLNKDKERKKTERERYKLRLSLLDVEKKRKEKVDEVARGLVDVRYKKAENIVLALEKEIDLLEVKKYLEDEQVALKVLEVNLMRIRRLLLTKEFNRQDIEQWSNEFSKSIKREEESKISLDEKRTEISNFLTEAKLKIDNIESEINKLKEKKDTIFKNKEKAYSDSISSLNETIKFIKRQMSAGQEIFSVNSELIRYKNNILNQYKLIQRELAQKKLFDIWRRSDRAISLNDFVKAGTSIEHFLREFIWFIPGLLNPVSWFKYVVNLGLYGALGWLVLISFFFLLLFVFCFLIRFLCFKVEKKLQSIYGGTRLSLSLSLLYVLFCVIKEKSISFFIWFFILLDILIGFKRFMGPLGKFYSYTDSIPLRVCFSLLSIPFLLILSSSFIRKFKSLNEKMKFAFIPQNFVLKYVLILKTLFYSTAVLTPLYYAFSLFVEQASRLPDVTIGIYLSVLEVVCIILLIVHKSVLLNLFSNKGIVTKWLQSVLSQYYYLALSFLMILLILSNPYVGYSNLAFLLLYAVPLTVLIFYGLFVVHYYIRQYSAFWFIREEDDEVIDRFDHAKAYYGIFVILTFLLLIFVTIVLVAKIWGATDPIGLITNLLQDKWTIPMGDEGHKFGFVQFFILALFIAGGFLTSTLLDKFVLSKIFDILRLDFGVRNTVSSILHYIIIYLIIVIGLNAVQLGKFIGWVSMSAVVGIGLASRDLIADLIAGFLVLIERPIEIGSFIEIDDNIGTVKKISARSTIIKNATQRTIIIPNKDLVNKTIINWNYGRTNVGFNLKVCVSYKSDSEKVKEILLAIVSSDNRILRSPAPTIRVEEFKDSGYEYLIRPFTSSRRVRDKWDIAASLRENILREFKEHGIVIPYPHMTLKFSETNLDEGPISIKFDK